MVSSRHHVTTLTRLHEIHYNTPLTLREPAQPKPFFFKSLFSLLPFFHRVSSHPTTSITRSKQTRKQRYDTHWRVDWPFICIWSPRPFDMGRSIPDYPYRHSPRLTVKRWVDQFHLIGQRGSCVLPTYELPYNLTYIRPDFAIVDNGGNNLASPLIPLSVAGVIFTVAKNILNIRHARHVAVCSALYRTKNTGSYSVTTTTTESVASITYFGTSVTLSETLPITHTKDFGSAHYTYGLMTEHTLTLHTGANCSPVPGL